MKVLRAVDSVFKPQIAFAHCDIPCGIYETNTLLMAAHTIERMVELLEELPMDKPTLKDRNNFTRCVHVKEKHADICEEQLVTLWADFFKAEHYQKWPDLHERIWKAVNLASDNKVDVSAEKARALMVACQDIAKVFEEAKVEPEEDLAGSVSDNPASPAKKVLGK
ncbi:MAG: superoxide dismutase, Ni [Candidatus Curtissbacteria bacterium]